MASKKIEVDDDDDDNTQAPPVKPDGGRAPAQGTLPDGVTHHPSNEAPPRKPIDVTHTQSNPRKPPASWKGSYMTCGQCGSFLGNASICDICNRPRMT